MYYMFWKQSRRFRRQNGQKPSQKKRKTWILSKGSPVIVWCSTTIKKSRKWEIRLLYHDNVVWSITIVFRTGGDADLHHAGPVGLYVCRNLHAVPRTITKPSAAAASEYDSRAGEHVQRVVDLRCAVRARLHH